MIDELQADVMGGGLPEVPHHQLDDVPVGGVRLHEHRDLWPDLLGSELAVLLELAIGPPENGEAEHQCRPRGDRQPVPGAEVRQIAPPIVDPVHCALTCRPCLLRTLAALPPARYSSAAKVASGQLHATAHGVE